MHYHLALHRAKDYLNSILVICVHLFIVVVVVFFFVSVLFCFGRHDDIIFLSASSLVDGLVICNFYLLDSLLTTYV